MPESAQASVAMHYRGTVDRLQNARAARILGAGSLICASAGLFFLIADFGEPADWRRLGIELAALVAAAGLLAGTRRR